MCPATGHIFTGNCIEIGGRNTSQSHFEGRYTVRKNGSRSRILCTPGTGDSITDREAELASGSSLGLGMDEEALAHVAAPIATSCSSMMQVAPLTTSDPRRSPSYARILQAARSIPRQPRERRGFSLVSDKRAASTGRPRSPAARDGLRALPAPSSRAQGPVVEPLDSITPSRAGRICAIVAADTSGRGF